jgi:hypothetical protein
VKGFVCRLGPSQANRDKGGKSLEIDFLHLPCCLIAIALNDPVDPQLSGPQHDATASFVAKIVDRVGAGLQAKQSEPRPR